MIDSTIQFTADSNPRIHFTMKSLTPGKYYVVSIVTISGTLSDEKRSTAYNETIRITPTRPGPPIKVSCPQHPKDNSLEISWEPPTNPNGEIVMYQIHVNPGSPTGFIINTQNNVTNYNVMGLSPERMYNFTVRTINDVVETQKVSDPSEVINCSTKHGVSTPPTKLNISEIGSRGFKISFEKPINVSGQLAGYRIIIMEGSACVQEIFLEGNCPQCKDIVDCANPQLIQKSEITQPMVHQVTDLKPYTHYIVKVAAVNGNGEGRFNNATAKTAEETPQKPGSIRATNIEAKTLTLSWDVAGPSPGNTTYTIEVHEGTDDTGTNFILKEPKLNTYGFHQKSLSITDLEEYWPYKFKVIAATIKGTSASDLSDIVRTKQAAPGQVENFTIEIRDGDYRMVYVTNNESMSGQVVQQTYTVPAGPPPIDKNMSLITTKPDEHKPSYHTITVDVNIDFFKNDLNGKQVLFGIAVCEESKCTFQGTLNKKEDWEALPNWNIASKSGFPLYRVTNETYMEEIRIEKKIDETANVGVIVGSIIGVIIVIVVVIVVLIFLQRRNRCCIYVYLKLERGSQPEKTSIPVHQFVSHMEDVMRDSKLKIFREFSNLLLSTGKESKRIGESKINLPRNRNIAVSYDFNRVKLLEGKKGSRNDYINASFILEHHYIMTQYPLPKTIGHFWQMVWEQNAPSIVVLSDEDNENIKGDQYFPVTDGAVHSVGVIDIELLATFNILERATLRKIRLSKNSFLRGKEMKNVNHYHVYGLKMANLSEELQSCINLVKSNERNVKETGPLIVHGGCSGTDYSGVFITTDYLVKSIDSGAKDVDVYRTALKVMNERMSAINTE
ncbi:phosphatidylinositol phosphatase PTPRQ-like, partial [Saccostrea cucullata]|uniref:phosphatidylinositol phosphatase PTPRQ-like n=1 Tax=Saccostrea cuccullata TaxID=36930 RepID=UPI002ED3B5E0